MSSAMKADGGAGRSKGPWIGLAGSIALILSGLDLILGAPGRRSRVVPRVTRASLAHAPSLPTRAIEEIRVGDRVLAGNPEGSVPELEVDPATWRRIALTLPKGPDTDAAIDIDLLRPE